jgi:hypothetical protein
MVSNPVNNRTNCTGNIGIRFATATSGLVPWDGVTIDETGPIRGWNVPTAIDLQKFGAFSGSRASWMTISLAAILAICVFLGVVRRRPR